MSALVAVLHFACIVIGAPAFRLLGAGDRLAVMAERGHWYPSALALGIGAAFSVCAAYALSAAGVLPPLPMRRTVLGLFTGVLFFRALAFPLLRSVFPWNSTAFWLVTSSICLLMGMLHLVGLKQVW